MEAVIRAYRIAKKRILLLDYDGVLVPLAPMPGAAAPPTRLLALLRALANDRRNTVVIISGRPPETLDEWLGSAAPDLAAEHGQFIKKDGLPWRRVGPSDDSWKSAVRRRMAEAVRIVPHSHIEEKHTSLVWHYRQSPPEKADSAAKSLLDDLKPDNKLCVTLGAKIIEVRLSSADKGRAALAWLRPDFDFVLAAGDDTTDEDLFAAMPRRAFTFKIGDGQSRAKHRLPSSEKFVTLLTQLVNSGEAL